LGEKPAGLLPRHRLGSAADVSQGTCDRHTAVGHKQVNLRGPSSCAASVGSVGGRLMATDFAVGGDVERALDSVGVPSHVLDTAGVVRWINPAAERLVGDVRGRQFTSVVAPEDSARARELFSRKVLGTAPATEATGVLVSTGGTRVAVEISAVPLMNGERVVGVFGLFEGRPDDRPTAPHPHLTPRQVEVLRLLEQGRSTKQIADELHLSTETVRNHIRRLFRALGVNSRLEAVAAAHRGWSPE
jgi:PAS domain S-box-containing protein